MIHHRLSNGLEIYIFVDKKTPIFSFSTFYRVGSMDENTGITGASHFVEHMRFRGNENLKGEEIDRYVRRHGGYMNGMTNEDCTIYFMALPSSEIEFPIKIESELMTQAAFKNDEFETERGVIIEERKQWIDDSPFRSLFEALKTSAFWAHSYKIPTVGWMDDLVKISREDIYEYYRSFYRPDNAYVIVGGDVDPDKVIGHIAKYFGEIASPDKPIKRPHTVEPQQNGIRRVSIQKPAELPIIMMAFHSPNIQNNDVYPLLVAEKILSSGESSRIYRNMVHDARIATMAGGLYRYLTRDPELFIFYAQASSDSNPENLEKALWSEIDRICNEDISIEELEKAKNLVETDFVYRREENIHEYLSRGFFHLSGKMENYEAFPDKIREVSADNVRDICAKTFTRNNATIAELNPIKGSGNNKAYFQNPGLCFYRNDLAFSLSTFPDGLPYWNDAIKFNLSNGIRVIAYPRHELPIFLVGALVNAGSIYDFEGRDGLANITANLLKAGTASRSSMDISNEVENVGGEYSISTHREYVILNMRFLSRFFKTALDILSECLIYPTFLDDEVQRYKELASGEIKAVEDEISSVTWREFNRFIFSDSPYAHPVLGELETLNEIRSVDVKEFHKKHYVSENTIIVVIGDFDQNQIHRDLEFFFNKMPQGGKSIPAKYIFANLEKPTIARYAKNSNQSSIMMGNSLFPRKHTDYFPYLALDYILGNCPLTSRLGRSVRVEKGLTYHIGSNMMTMSNTGYWGISFQTRNESASDAVKLVRDEVRRLRTEMVTDEELNDFKTNARGRSSFDVESNRGLAQKLLTISYYDLGDNYLSEYFKTVENVTREQILDVAQRYLDPDRFKLLVVCDEKLPDLIL